jgi:nucleoside-diphosphate-sugar epimerase
LLHIAGGHRPTKSEELFAANVQTLLTALEALGDRLSAVAYAGSVAVYGSRPRCDSPLVAPDTPYGRSKWQAEAVLELLARTATTPVAVVRIASVYGPGNTGRNAVAELTSAVVARRPFVIGPVGSPPSARDYVHVDDVVATLVAALGQTVVTDVGSGVASCPRDLVAAVRGLGFEVDVLDEAEPGSDARFACPPVAATLGLAPPTRLVDGLGTEFAWRAAEGAGA